MNKNWIFHCFTVMGDEQIELNVTQLALGTIMGGGHFVTLDNKRFVFNDPGIYTLFKVLSRYRHSKTNLLFYRRMVHFEHGGFSRIFRKLSKRVCLITVHF